MARSISLRRANRRKHFDLHRAYNIRSPNPTPDKSSLIAGKTTRMGLEIWPIRLVAKSWTWPTHMSQQPVVQAPFHSWTPGSTKCAKDQYWKKHDDRRRTTTIADRPSHVASDPRGNAIAPEVMYHKHPLLSFICVAARYCEAIWGPYRRVK